MLKTQADLKMSPKGRLLFRRVHSLLPLGERMRETGKGSVSSVALRCDRKVVGRSHFGATMKFTLEYGQNKTAITGLSQVIRKLSE
jgi:hypothetical protein